MALVDDDAAVTATVDTDVVVIAPSTSGSSLGSKYTGAPAPEVVFASSAWDTMGLTEQDGIFADSTTLAWVDVASPIAAWLPSPVQVVPVSKPMRSMVAGNLAAGASPVAVRANNTTQNVVFTFDPGDDLTAGTTPAARGVIGFSEPALADLTVDGRQLVMNLVTWSAQGVAPLVDDAGARLTAAGAPAYCPTVSTVVACYEMNDLATTMADSATSPAASDVASANGTNGVSRKLWQSTYPAQYYFKGWTGKTDANGNLVDNTSGPYLASTYSQVRVDKTTIAPSESFNPGTDPWTVGVRLKPALIIGSNEPAGTLAHLPRPPGCATCDAKNPSFNVVQKGRSTTPEGFYKIEIMGYASSTNLAPYVNDLTTTTALPYQIGSVHCVYADSDGTSVDALSTTVLVTEKKYYDIKCSRNGTGITLTVQKAVLNSSPEVVTGTQLVAGTTPGLQTIAPSTTTYGPILSIGKKADSTNIGDAFTGWVDYVMLKRALS